MRRKGFDQHCRAKSRILLPCPGRLLQRWKEPMRLDRWRRPAVEVRIPICSRKFVPICTAPLYRFLVTHIDIVSSRRHQFESPAAAEGKPSFPGLLLSIEGGDGR